MEGSVGTALRNARLKKQITIEEAAKATKIHPQRLEDLERDEYTRFPSLSYARSFLLLYARYLHLDISGYQTMDVGSPAGAGDYEYLRHENGVDTLRFTPPGMGPPPKPTLFRGLMIVLGIAIVVLMCGYYLLQLHRLEVKQLVQKNQSSDRAALEAPLPTPTPVLKAIPLSTATPTASPSPSSSPAAVATGSLAAPSTTSTGAVLLVPPFASATAGLIAESGTGAESGALLAGTGSLLTDPASLAASVSTPSPTPAPTPLKLYELRVRVTRKAWVTVYRDDPKGEPIFSGYLSPGAAPRLYRGQRFWVKTRESKDRAALVVSSDGKPVKVGPTGAIVPPQP
jgi:cytoskeletal protein RodZ